MNDNVIKIEDRTVTLNGVVLNKIRSVKYEAAPSGFTVTLVLDVSQANLIVPNGESNERPAQSIEV